MTQQPAPNPWLDRAALAWAALVAVALFAVFRDAGFDDPFITYRYAANLAGGAGFVYNPGERVLSTTAPLYALALAPIAAAGLSLPLASNLIGCLSLGAGALALWRLGRMGGQVVAGAVAALLFPLSPFLVPTLGAETIIFITLALWGFVAAWAGRPILAALAMACATLTRADAAMAMAMAGLVLLVRRGWRPALRYGAVCGLAVAPFLLASWWYFGAPLPATLGAKRSQAHVPGSRGYLEGLLAHLGAVAAQPLFWPTVGLAPVGVAVAALRGGPLALVVAWGLLHALAYSLIGVTSYFWYYAPAFTGLLAAVALGAELLAGWLGRWAGRRAGLAVVAALTLVTLAGHLGVLRASALAPYPRLALYREAGAWLRANSTPGARVGSFEIGVIGFYSERPMVDFAGLIQPDVARIFDAGGDYADAARYAIERYRPTYLVSQERILALVGDDPGLRARCAEAAALPDPRYPEPLRIYRCSWP
ncbi:MAG: hypothetical protein HGA45_22295 [Chloroflexales bacterium]|nr:hypothetical protein [Chloroflexales bacterium]